MEAYTERVKGCMIAVVKLPPEKAEALCDGVNTHPANYNGALQTVVACRAEAEEEFLAKVKEAGGRAMKLRVSGMFHCPELRLIFPFRRLHHQKGYSVLQETLQQTIRCI